MRQPPIPAPPLTLVQERARSMREWRRRTAAPARSTSARMIIPLPPGVSSAQAQRLQTLLDALHRKGGARVHPVETILAAGPFGAVAARLFAHLTGAAPPRATPARSVGTPARRCAMAGSSLLICADPTLGEGGLNRLATAIGDAPLAPGLIYAVDLDCAVMLAVKAAFSPVDPGAGEAFMLDPMTRGFADLSAPGWRAAPARQLVEGHLAAAMRDPACPVKAVFTHGNGFDFDLGGSVLCGFQSDVIPQPSSPAMFPCVHTRRCLRDAQARLHPDDLASEVLVLASCQGVLDAPAEVDLSVTAFANMAREPGVRSIITTAGFWVAAPESGLRLLEAVGGAESLGALAGRLNATLDPLARNAFLLFGNPAAPAPSPPALETRRLSVQDLESGAVLEPGLHRIAGPEGKARCAVIVLGAEPERVRIRVAKGGLDTRALLIFNGEPAALRALAPDAAPTPVEHIHARARAMMRTCDSFSHALADREAAGRWRSGALDLITRLQRLDRAMEERRAGALEVITPDEFAVTGALDAECDKLCCDLLTQLRDWSVAADGARFMVSVWRPAHRQVRLTTHRVCAQCQVPLRDHVYEPLDAGGARQVTYSPGCSLIADMPADQPVTVDIARPVEREDAFEITVAIRQRGPGESQIAAAAFLMSGYEVWPESTGPVEVKRLAPEDTWTFATALKKPPQALEGEHWFVVVGLIDGVPFTRTRRVLMEAARARDPMR